MFFAREQRSLGDDAFLLPGADPTASPGTINAASGPSIQVAFPSMGGSPDDGQRLLLHLDMRAPEAAYGDGPAGNGRRGIDRLSIIIVMQSVAFTVEVAVAVYLTILFYPDLVSGQAAMIQIWSLVWLARLMIQNTVDIALIVSRKHGLRPPPSLYFIQTTNFIFGFAWFLLGSKLLWFDKRPPQPDAARMWATILWWYQALSFIIPCATYATICLCLPCLIFAVIRMQVPYRDQRPTPESVLQRIDVKTFDEHVNELRQQQQPPQLGRTESGGGESTSIVPGGVAMVENMHVAFGLPAQASGSPAPVGDWNKACPICMLELEGTDQLMIMPCDPRHFFHKPCVEQWLRNSQVCPICRANVVSILAPDNVPDEVVA